MSSESPAATTTPGAPPLWWALAQLAGLSFFVPMGKLTGPQRALAEPVSALGVGLGVMAFAVAIYFLVARLTSSGWKALAVTSVGLVLFWQWGAFSSYGRLLGWAASLVVSTLVIMAAWRLAERRLFQKALLAVSVTLPLTLLVVAVADAVNTPPPSLEVDSIPALGDPQRTPDVVLVVLDGYARSDVLGQEYGYDNGPFVADLEAAGFEVADSANANYTMTHFSVPSMLNMSYIESESGWLSNSDLVQLKRMVSGENAVVSALKGAGYSYLHAAGDNWLNHCPDASEVCLPGPALDQTVNALLAETPVGPALYPRSGDPSTALNRARIDQLRDWREVSGKAGGGRPLFAYVHLLLPHPPLYLDADCDLRVNSDMSGQALNLPTMSDELVAERRAAYVDQLKCANTTVRAFLDQLDGDEIVVITSDHGPDSHGLFAGDPRQWTKAQIHERLATFTAVRLPSECENRDDPNLQLVNTFRIVLGCIFDTRQLAPVAGRYQAASFSGAIIPIEDPDADDQ